MIKSQHLDDNAGFPLILSTKMSKDLGEILMTYEGRDIFSKY